MVAKTALKSQEEEEVVFEWLHLKSQAKGRRESLVSWKLHQGALTQAQMRQKA